MAAFYNDSEPYVCEWLRNLIKAGLIPDGDVDNRSIRDVRPEDLRGYTQCHFFAGIGGWAYALRLAQWPDDREVWTGSCPCQPFSAAGQEKGRADDRHLWPEWYRLIRECRPAIVFGEQVSRAIRHGWLDEVATDLEAEGYAFGAAVYPVSLTGAPHNRFRIYFVADACSSRFQGLHEAGRRVDLQPPSPDVWGRWAPEPRLARVANGIPRRVVADRIKGFGNAIVPEAGAAFIRACM